MKKTNEQILRSLIRELDTIEVAILRERIIKICDITLADIDNWKAGAGIFVSNGQYKAIIQRIQKMVEFET